MTLAFRRFYKIYFRFLRGLRKTKCYLMVLIHKNSKSVKSFLEASVKPHIKFAELESVLKTNLRKIFPLPWN